MRIGFTGTRKGLTVQRAVQLRNALETISPESVVHGDCIGADAQFHDICRELGIRPIELRPCDIASQRAGCIADKVYPVKPPLERNRDIVNDCDMLIACPSGHTEILRSGTWQTVRYARKVGRIMLVLF